MQRIDTLSLYLKNARSTFFKPYRLATEHGVDWADIIFMLVHTAALPVTMTAGAGLKTAFDVYTRHPMSQSDVDKLIGAIPKITDEEFDKLVANVLKYHAKSDSSKALLKCFTAAQEEEQRNNDNFKLRTEGEIKNDKLTYFFEARNSLGISQTFDVKVKSDYPFSEMEQKEIQQKVDANKVEMANKRRQVQRDAIIGYLKENKNVGKKMQHVIKEEVESRRRSNP